MPGSIPAAACCDPPRGPASGWWLLDASPFVPRWDCGSWAAWEGWAAVGADLVVAACYYLIPAVGWWLLRRRPQLAPDPTVAHLSLAFVVLCGTTHVADAAMYWWPAYRLNLLARAATAAVSAATLAVLWRRRWHLAGYVSPAEHARVVAAKEAAERHLTEEAGRKARQAARVEGDLQKLRAEALELERAEDDRLREKARTIRALLHDVRDHLA